MKDSTHGFQRIIRLAPPVRFRLFGFILVVVCGTLLLTWMTRTTWAQLERLQKEHAAVSSESFYLGVTLRSSIRNLNSELLRYGLTHDKNVQSAFIKESTGLREWMEANRVHLKEMTDLRLLKNVGLAEDLGLLQKAQKSYEIYLAQTAGIMAPGRPAPDVDTFYEVYGRVQRASKELLLNCDQLVALQRSGFGEFLAETQRTLANHFRLLHATSVLIVVLAAAIAILAYRGMIAPLRLGLSQSRSVIERQEKLASLGVLASGVAHEIRNPLTAIKFRLFSLKKAVPTLAENEDATIIANEINRLEEIVRAFLRFARPSDPQLTAVPTERMLGEAHEFLKGKLEHSEIHLEWVNSESVWVNADPQQIKQVLINLIQNAAESIQKNGVISLKLQKGTAELDHRVKPVAILAVSDSGKGIPPEVEARLFDPFFTTKEGGTGLGLAISARIVEKHGGMLRYETEVDHGTTFEIVLPQIEHNATENITNRG